MPPDAEPVVIELPPDAIDEDGKPITGRVFVPNSLAQLKVVRSTANQCLYSSALGKGKTRTICECADRDCREYEFNQVVLSRKTLASMWKTTLDVLLEEVVDQTQRGEQWKPSAHGGATLFYPNGSQLLCVGLDDPGRARSGAFGSVYVDQAEELEEEEADSIADRLRRRNINRRRIVFAVNPDSPGHWIYRRYRPDKGSRKLRTTKEIVLADGTVIAAGHVWAEVVLSGPTDNYENLPLSYRIQLAMRKGRYKLRFVDGLWVAFEGQVYDQFAEDTHVVDRPLAWDKWGGYPPPSWQRYRSIDFGYENPFVMQWWARQPATSKRLKERFWLYREIYMSRKVVPQHGQRALELEKRELEALRDAAYRLSDGAEQVRDWMARLQWLEFSMTVADHDREDRENLHQIGIVTDPGEKDVSNGIQTVYDLLAVDGAGDAGIVFVRDAVDQVDERLEEEQSPTRTWEEVAGYRWQKHGEGRVVKEEPVKIDDHGLDAMRYLFHTMKVMGDLGAA